MAAIKGSHTKPELQIRKALHAAGFRYRLHAKDLPGKPDLVFPKYRAVIFVNGCFWHGHNCHLFKWPATRTEFWRAKIERNVVNDTRVIQALEEDMWRTATVWECALKGRNRLDGAILTQQLVSWLRSDVSAITVRGRLTAQSDASGNPV